MPAPIALFVFKRPFHTERTLEALAANRLALDTDLVVFCDGPKSEADWADVTAVRDAVHRTRGFRSVTVRERDINAGLAYSVIEGVSSMLRSHDRVIVVEDDMISGPDFLDFMNQGLDLYADEAHVASIHGYVYPTDGLPRDPFFLRGADCWGWATWRRAWQHFDPDATRLLERLEHDPDAHLFDFDGSFRFTDMLRRQQLGLIDSWAIRWYASTFLAGMLTLYPPRTLIKNIGTDGSGTHGELLWADDRSWWRMPRTLHRQEVIEDPRGRAAFAAYGRRHIVPSLWARVRSRLGALKRRSKG